MDYFIGATNLDHSLNISDGSFILCSELFHCTLYRDALHRLGRDIVFEFPGRDFLYMCQC